MINSSPSYVSQALLPLASKLQWVRVRAEVMASPDLDIFTEHVIAVLYVAVIAETVFIHQECT